MKFHCLYCSHQEEFSEKEPSTWFMKRYAAKGEYRHKCPKCGAAMGALSFLLRDGYITIDGAALFCFSDCINAEYCLGFDQYAPDCEAPGLKQKCLLTLHKEIGILNSRLDDINKRHPGKGGLKLVKMASERSDK